MSFKPITVPPPGHAVVTPDGVTTYATQSVSLDVYHATPNRVVMRIAVGDATTIFELDAAARTHLIGRLNGEAAQ